MRRLEKFRVKLQRFRRVRLPRRIRKVKRFSRTPHAVPVLTIGALLLISVGGYILARSTDKLPPVHDAKIVIISHDKQQQIVPSKEKTVGSLLRKLHLR